MNFRPALLGPTTLPLQRMVGPTGLGWTGSLGTKGLHVHHGRTNNAHIVTRS